MATLPSDTTNVEPETIADRPENEPEQQSAESPDSWVQQYGDLLFRTAIARVSSRPVAEDLVQDTLLAAWRGREKFDGRSQRSTWLVAILKRKIADHFRATGRSKETPSEDLGGVELFDQHGLWRESVGDLTFRMETATERDEFWQSLQHCVGGLPAMLSQAFVVRELESMPPEQAAEHLGITKQNLAVRLHRARLLLRDCLEGRWLGERGAST